MNIFLIKLKLYYKRVATTNVNSEHQRKTNNVNLNIIMNISTSMKLSMNILK